MRAAPRARGEEGSTLVELLIATTIMGMAVIAIVMAMSTVFTTSASNRQSTNSGIVARDYAEALEYTAAQSNVWCSAAYSVTSYTPPSGYTVSPSYGACPAANGPQFQTVVLTVTAPNGSTETLRMVVRKQ